MKLIRLVYASVSASPLGAEEIQAIAQHSAGKNFERGITGVLCCGNQQFLQVLEGERSEVSKLYTRISNDNRHGSIQLISANEIDKPLFSEWGMKLLSLGNGPSLSRARAAMLQKNCNMTTFSPCDLSAFQALGLVQDLAASMLADA